MQLKGLKKAVGDYQRANAEGHSYVFGRLMFDVDSGELWTERIYKRNDNQRKAYPGRKVIDLGRVVEKAYGKVTMKTVCAVADTYSRVVTYRGKPSGLYFEGIYSGVLYLTTHGVRIDRDTSGDSYVNSKVADGCLVFVEKTNVAGVYVYGAKQLKDSANHKAGYIWSSRPGVLNGLFNTHFVGVVIDNASFYVMPVKEATKYLPVGYRYVQKIADGEHTFSLQREAD